MFTSLRPVEIDAVLLHEIAHHHPRHILFAWLRLAACAVWWWNPLAWAVGARLRHTHEEVCDDLVVSRGGVPAEIY